MFPKKGNSFPSGNDRQDTSQTYPALIAGALRREFGNSHQATKTVRRWTGASERTVKHWFAGRHGPGGNHLIALMRESKTVFETVLRAAGREDAAVVARVLAAHAALVEALGLLEQMGLGPPALGSIRPDWAAATEHRSAGGRGDDRTGDCSPDADRGSLGRGFNVRQRWYLDALSAGIDVRADDVRRQWGVSGRTARRDIAALRRSGLIKFIGSRKKGRYQLLP